MPALDTRPSGRLRRTCPTGRRCSAYDAIRSRAAIRFRAAMHFRAAMCLAAACAALAAVVLEVAAAAPAAPASPATAVNTQRLEGWHRDLTYLATELPKRHVNLFFKTAQQDWEKAVAELDAAIPTLNDDEIRVGLMKLVAMIGDSHTILAAGPEAGQHSYPLVLYWFKDGLIVLGAQDEHKELLGARLVSIEGHPVAEALSTVSPVFAYDNQSQLKSQAPGYLVLAEVLHGLKLAASATEAQFTFALPSGEERTVTLTPVAGDPRPSLKPALDPMTNKPAYMRGDGRRYWTEWLPFSETFYLGYDVCAEQDGLPMKDFTVQVLDGLSGMPFKRLVIELRNNSGGNSALLDPLIDALAARKDLARGKLFVIIGRRTFSSAVLNALSLKDKTSAVFFGEPTGGKPSHYGEVKTFALPVSGLDVSYSTKYFDYHGDQSDSLKPDVTVELSSVDFLSGRDPVLEAAIAWTGG